MKMGWFFRQVRFSVVAVALLLSGSASRALAQTDHDHAATGQQQEQTIDQKARANALVKIVRQVTAGFQTPDTLPQEYQLVLGCVSGGDFGAMGLHFLNMSLVGDGEVDKVRARNRAVPSRCRTARCESPASTIWCTRPTGTTSTPKARHSSKGSSFTSSKVPIASGSRRSTRCTSGPGRTTRAARLRIGIPRSAVTHSPHQSLAGY